MYSPTLLSNFTDIDALTRMPRVNSVAASASGRVIAAISEANEHGSKLVSSLWELDPEGKEPATRLTFSAEGESAPRFSPDGSVLFHSKRPDPTGEAEADTVAIWRLPEHGEAHVVASAPGGLSLLGVADDGTILAKTSVLVGGGLDDDADRRKDRKDAGRTTIWHTGMPIRRWDQEVGDTSAHLVLISPEGNITDLTDQVPPVALGTAAADISADGTTVATGWTERVTGGSTQSSVVLIDTATLQRRTFLAADDTTNYGGPVFCPDGKHLAVTRSTTATPTDTSYSFLEVHSMHDDAVISIEVGDLTTNQYVFTDTGDLLVTGDLHSSGAILRADPGTGAVETVADQGVFSSLAPGAEGDLYALRNDVATPARPIRLRAGSAAVELSAPGEIDALPGTLSWVETDVQGVKVGGWLCLPHEASAQNPAPAMLWIHGGPHGSYNAWSWRWSPWVAVARGYAVLMPDPAMSTGYGHSGLNRGWPRLPDVVFNECETLFDQVLTRDDVDGTRTAMLGASFGGFMANWIAGHSDRFDAIVSHAGLWALDQQHRTTDAAAGKMRVHGHEQDNPQWYRDYSPHHSADNVTTPVLITHGNRDYRVPVSEAIRMWWDLVSGWDGAPETMPHRFLQLTSENHWVLTPSNSYTWYETVLAFCDQHVLGADPIPDTLPW